ncbi:hypothetical protein K1719_001642 [Acacia pycnantha]|nr:hypothetical protein K1719_001642 [Acacia pycnantha]
MGGIGKTTLAKAVFDKLTTQFESFYFAKDVRKQVERNGLDELQVKCLKELFKDEDMNTYNLGSTFVQKRLQRKIFFLVLDDVDNALAIHNLIKACGWFGEGSRIIITSRDEQVLKNTSAYITYHVPQLDRHQAFHLFSLNAFKQKEPSKSLLKLSKWVVGYCEENPLALRVLGCFLQGRREEVWRSAMEKLNQTLHKDIFNVLKLSFDGLDDKQKNLFLDLAFFLNKAWRICLEDCRSLYNSSANIEIIVLKQRSLISENKIGGIEMHALLKEMGLEISRQQLMSNPEKPIRVWRHQDIYHVFDNDKGIEAIRFMSLDASKIKKSTLRASGFRKMRDLVFLDAYKSDRQELSKLNICEDLDYLSEELRFLSWEECPLSYVPIHFCAENLTKLKMRNGNIRQCNFGKEIRICGVSFKHEVIPVEEIEELRMWTQSLVSLLPFVRIVELFEQSIEVGHDFNQHFDHGYRYERFRTWWMLIYDKEDSVDEKESSVDEGDSVDEQEESSVDEGDSVDEQEESSVDEGDSVDEQEESSVDEERGDRGEMMNGHQVVMMSLMEDDEMDDVVMEHCCSKSVRFTRVPNSITRWSLLKDLTLKSLPIFNEHCRRIKPLLDVTRFSTPDIPPSSNGPVDILYGSPREFFRWNIKKAIRRRGERKHRKGAKEVVLGFHTSPIEVDFPADWFIFEGRKNQNNEINPTENTDACDESVIGAPGIY